MITTANILIDDLSIVFLFELSTHSPSMFDTSSPMHEAHKPSLAGDCSATLSTLTSDVEVCSILASRSNRFHTMSDVRFLYVHNTANVVFDGHSRNPSTNPENKQAFIKLLSAHHNAVLLIDKTAMNSKETRETILVGENIDFPVHVCYHADGSKQDFIFRSEI